MIAFFRRTLASKLALGLLALVLLAFIVTGVFTREGPGAGGGGAGGDAVATIGDATLTAPQVEDRVRRQYAQYAQQQPGLTLAQFVGGGGFDAIVDQTIAATALEVYGRRIGLAASDRQVDGQIAGIQAFQGPTGKFDPAVFRSVLGQQHMSERSLRADIAGDIVRQMIYLPASGATTLPDGLIRPYAALLVETRKGTIGLVPAALTADPRAPADADVARFYKTGVAAYSAPERRVLRYALVGRQQVAATAVPSEAEVRRAYDAAPAKYAARETRTLSQVVLPDQATAAAFAAKVRGGTAFAAAAKAAGFGAGDIAIGRKSQTEFATQIGAAPAAAAFAAAQGAVAGPVRGAFGWAVLKVDAIERSAGVPFATARPQIAGDLVRAKQDKALADLVAKLQDAIDDGKGFADVARANGLAVQETPALTAAGGADDPAFRPSADVQPLLKPGFDAAADGTASVETVQQGERYALLSVARVLPAAPLPFAKVRDRVVADYRAKRASDRAKAIADGILAKVRSGTTMAAAFAAAPVRLPPPKEGSGRRLDLAQARVAVPASLKALFTMPRGTARLVPAEGGAGWYVVQLQDIAAPDPKTLGPLIQSSRGEIVEGTTSEYIEQLAHAAGEAVGVRRNPAAIAALRARLLGTTPTAAP